MLECEQHPMLSLDENHKLESPSLSSSSRQFRHQTHRWCQKDEIIDDFLLFFPHSFQWLAFTQERFHLLYNIVCLFLLAAHYCFRMCFAYLYFFPHTGNPRPERDILSLGIQFTVHIWTTKETLSFFQFQIFVICFQSRPRWRNGAWRRARSKSPLISRVNVW